MIGCEAPRGVCCQYSERRDVCRGGCSAARSDDGRGRRLAGEVSSRSRERVTHASEDEGAVKYEQIKKLRHIPVEQDG